MPLGQGLDGEGGRGSGLDTHVDVSARAGGNQVGGGDSGVGAAAEFHDGPTSSGIEPEEPAGSGGCPADGKEVPIGVKSHRVGIRSLPPTDDLPSATDPLDSRLGISELNAPVRDEKISES